jgi:hypothetical protein
MKMHRGLGVHTAWRGSCALGLMLVATGCPGSTPGGGDASGTGGINSAGDDGSGGTADDGPGTDGDGSGSGSDDGASDGSSGMSDDSTGTPADGTTGPGPDAELVFLQVDPPDSVLEVDLDTPISQAFTVTGHYDDGSSVDVTAQIDSWSVTNAMVGSMNGSTLEIPGFPSSTFASTIVTATMGAEEGQAQVTLAAYTMTGDQQDFFFVLPYEDPAGNQDKPLTFSTDVKALDVFFNMDTTGSMSGPILNLQSSLASTVIPAISAQVPNTEFGAGIFEDFPEAPYGEANCNYFPGQFGPDQPFQLLQEITANVGDVQNAVNSMSLPGGYPVGCGNDTPESNIEALYQIATGDGLAGPGFTAVPSNNSGIGGVGFRDGSMPIIVSITDAVSHENAANACVPLTYTSSASITPVAHDRADLYGALDGICARVVPVAVNDASPTCGALADGIEFAETTRATVPPEAWDQVPGGRPPGCAATDCCTGLNGAGVPTNGQGLCPLVYRASAAGTGLGQSIVDGLQMVAAYSPFDVTTNVSGTGTDEDGVALPVGTTTADFIKAVTPLSHGPVPLPGVPDPTMTATSFENVIPDTDVTFSIVAYNDFVPQSDEPRLFVANISVIADGCYDLDEREVFILVPPQKLPPPG